MPRPTLRRTLAPVSLALALLVGACGGGSATDGSSGSASPTSARAADGHAAHGMDVEIGTVDEVAELGEGPSVGDRWEIPVGVNICGQFVEVPDGAPVGAVSATTGATALVQPTDDATAGHGATLGDYAESAGIGLSTGEIRLPEGVIPPVIEVTGTAVALDGATFRTGDACGESRGEVQVWVYSAEAVRTGREVLTVVTDPERIPFVEDGMALVLALAPESSLPTLPPSALGLG